MRRRGWLAKSMRNVWPCGMFTHAEYLAMRSVYPCGLRPRWYHGPTGDVYKGVPAGIYFLMVRLRPTWYGGPTGDEYPCGYGHPARREYITRNPQNYTDFSCPMFISRMALWILQAEFTTAGIVFSEITISAAWFCVNPWILCEPPLSAAWFAE